MSSFQPAKLHSVEEVLDFIPEHERMIVETLRWTILRNLPDCKERISYSVPYYYRHYAMCFIWPSAIQWGKVKSNGVQLGFCYGHLLNDDDYYLERGKRKQVYTKTFYDVKEIDSEVIKSYLFDALMVDDSLKKNRTKIKWTRQ